MEAEDGDHINMSSPEIKAVAELHRWRLLWVKKLLFLQLYSCQSLNVLPQLFQTFFYWLLLLLLGSVDWTLLVTVAHRR